MIAALHANLTLACRKSEGRCRLSAWAQGPSLYSSVNIITAPRNGDAREKERQTVRLPLRPDALFTLETTTSDAKRRFHYCYEADRKTMPMTKMKEKFRAYVNFLRQQRHRAAWNVDSIRAVLVETLDAPHAHMLLNVARDPSVCGDRPNGLFWFTTSRADSKEPASSGAAAGPLRALTSAQLILKRVWASSKDTFHSLTE